jgi:hypothetical protein
MQARGGAWQVGDDIAQDRVEFRVFSPPARTPRSTPSASPAISSRRCLTNALAIATSCNSSLGAVGATAPLRYVGARLAG